ncbi:MAG: hypothetical protein ACRBB3_08545 [Alphaproteobacteria bacterium]
MKQKVLWGVVGLLFVVAMFFGLTFLAKNQKNELPIVEFIDRKYAIFKDDKAYQEKIRPFLIKVELAGEGRDSAFFNVTYYVPKGDRGVYRIGVSPDSNNFVSSSDVLVPGYNVVRVNVNFRPKSIFVRAKKTQYLNIEIYSKGNKVDPVSGEAAIVKSYWRRAVFHKHWRKPKGNLGTINPTQFHWK